MPIIEDSYEDTNRYVYIPEYMSFENRFCEWEEKMFHATDEPSEKEAWRIVVLEKRRQAHRIWSMKLGR